MKQELFRFVEDATVWTVTSGDTAIVYNTETYTPATMGRSEIESKNEMNKANIEIKFDMDNAMARRWMVDRIEAVVTLTVFEKDENDDISVAWKGRLASVKPATAEITLIFESIFTSLRRPGLRARYLRSCRHSLYGRGCGLDKEGFATTGTPTAVSGNSVTVTEAASFPDGYFATGMLEAADGSLRFITNHIGSAITLIRPSQSLAEAFAAGPTTVRLFPGCPRTRDVCDERFNNLANYGGFDWIPTRNPFDGSSIV